MKKALVSFIIIGAFVIYSFLHSHSGLTAIVPNTLAGSRSSSGSTATPSLPEPPGATAPASATPGTLYKNGSYTGSIADAQWGVVQVQAVIKDGKITDVQFLQYPHDRSRSVYINSYADSQLSSEAIQAQNANVDVVTGATDSSEAFMQSLSDALSQARA